MIGFLLTGHGRFAGGMLSGLELILGKQTDIVTVEFLDGDTKTELEQKMSKGFADLESAEHILVFCDMLCGSPFHTALMLAMNDPRVKIVFGVNLGMLMNLALQRNTGESFEAIVAVAVEAGTEQVGLYVEKPQIEDDDF